MTGRCGVVVAHGRLADGLLSAVARVAGRQENLWAVSNDGLNGEALVESIEAILDERADGRQAFLFTDLDGGSCGQACRRLLEAGRVTAILHGTNLPLLVEFVFLQEEPLEAFLEALVEKSRRSLGVRR